MKKGWNVLIAILILNSTAMAKPINLNEEITINVSAEKLWEMVGPGFIEVYKWSSSVDHAVGSGAAQFDGAVCSERSCDLNAKGFSSISETLTKYDAANMNLAYEVNSGMPNFISKAANDWTVVSINENQSKLVMKANFETKGLMGAMMNGMMKKKMTKLLQTVLNDAKVYAETGAPSEVKKARIASLSKKNKSAA